MIKSLEELKKKGSFSFLNNEILEEELYLSDSYRSYLHEILGWFDSNTPDHIKFSLSHNIVIYYCWILELILHAYVSLYFSKKWNTSKLKKFCKRIDYKEKTEILPLKQDKDIWIVYCERHIKYENFSDNIQLHMLIKWCKDHKLLSNQLIEKMDKIRKIRNWVHLNTIMDVKDIFWYKDLTAITKDVMDIFGSLKKEYIELDNEKATP